MRINLHSLGVNLYNKLIIIELIPTDLPDPVVPAMSKCGIFSKSAIKGIPAMSLPRDKIKLFSAPLKGEVTIVISKKYYKSESESDSETIKKQAMKYLKKY